ncbi:hypothetical protein GQ457_10G011680 [Hibiscus cannabinus]
MGRISSHQPWRSHKFVSRNRVTNSAAVLPVIEQKLLAAWLPSKLCGYGSAYFQAFYTKLMWSEGFGMTGSPLEHASKLWLQDHAKFCEVMEQCQAEMKTLCNKIVGIMLGSLGLTHEDYINVGDLTQIVTNGKLKSVLHRVVVNSTCHRLATSFFLMASSDAKISPLRKLVDSSHPPLYQAMTGKEYFQQGT